MTHETLLSTLRPIVEPSSQGVLKVRVRGIEDLLSTLREDIRILTEEIDRGGYGLLSPSGRSERVREIWTRRDEEGS